ncbi:MAG: FGGY family carbohydrate kinase [Acidobacteriota bacterium]|nr:FGGY family carbohydrate kinase [Acidobacteriota bacterium]
MKIGNQERKARRPHLSDPLTLGIDVGTSSAKAVVADPGGSFFASATRSYSYTTPEHRQAEQDPEDWWDAVCSLTQELLSTHPEIGSRLRAVGISGQGVAAIVLGHNRKPLRNAILWLDTRSAAQATQLCESYGEFIAAISGKTPAAYNVEPKLLWLRQHEPANWNSIWKVMTTTGYVTFRLTGQAVMNHSDGGILLSYDLNKHHWSEEALACMDLPRSIFCELASCHEVIGEITPEAASQTGLPAGLPVVAGGEDTSSAGLAMGVVSENDVQLSMGSASTVYVPLRRPVSDSRLLAFPHVLDGLTLLGGSMVAGGLAIDWLLKILDGTLDASGLKADALNILTARAAQVDPGSQGLIFLPYLAGELQPINDGFARGVFFGLGLQTSKAHLFRAVLEGTAFAITHNLSLARELGAAPEQILAVGGPIRNDLWCQIISDVTGMPLHAMEDRGGAALGDAILAGMGVQLFADPLVMQRAHARLRKSFSPNWESHREYQRLLAIYREVYPRLRDLFPKLLSEPKAKVAGNVHL